MDIDFAVLDSSFFSNSPDEQKQGLDAGFFSKKSPDEQKEGLDNEKRYFYQLHETKRKDFLKNNNVLQGIIDKLIRQTEGVSAQPSP